MGQQLFWIPLSPCCGHHLFLSEPFSEAALSGKSHAVTVSPPSLIIQLSTPAYSYSPFPQSKSMLIIISPIIPPQNLEHISFLPSWKLHLFESPLACGEQEELDVPTLPSSSVTPNPPASSAFHKGQREGSISQEKRNGYLPLGLAQPGRWLVGCRHGPRSLHPPHREGITEPLMSHITAARHLTVHLVAL